ncbi:MAG: DegT/DnrJ/EryC1/StrS family aminotransferase [bacterium]
MAVKYPLARVSLSDKAVKAFEKVIKSGWVTQGPVTIQFENAFKKYVDCRYACAVSNCTSALHMALLAVGVSPGDVVITVSHSFIASANAVRHCNAEPVFIDIYEGTLNMSASRLECFLKTLCKYKNKAYYFKKADKLAAAPSPLAYCKPPLGRVAAIMPVHQLGNPCDIKSILKIAASYKIPVVEDAACALGSEVSMDGGKSFKKIGCAQSDIVCFSFHPRKIITTGDGGMLTTNKLSYDKKFRLLRQHAMSIPDYKRHQSNDIFIESYIHTGYNYRLTDIQAAIGLTQLKEIDKLINERKKLARNYYHLLESIPIVNLPLTNCYGKPNWQSYYVSFNKKINQKKLMAFLLSKGIASKPGVTCIHREPAYSSNNSYACLEKSEYAQCNGIIIPLYSGLTYKDQVYIIDMVKRGLSIV